jgi:hypothetical protein
MPNFARLDPVCDKKTAVAAAYKLSCKGILIHKELGLQVGQHTC